MPAALCPFIYARLYSYLLVQLLDQSGRLLRSKRISAKQGTVTANADGGCTLLFTKGLGGEDNVVYLATLNQTLREVSEVETPLRGRGGRSYQLISTPRGHLAIGEGPEQRQQAVAEFDRSDRLIWQQTVTTDFTPLIVPFKSGFYIVAEVFLRRGFDVEKYVY